VAGPDPVRQKGVRVCVWAPKGRLGKCLNYLAATRTQRRGRVAGANAHGEAMARAWLGWGVASEEAGTAVGQCRVCVRAAW
jgi:hypothetical protein